MVPEQVAKGFAMASKKTSKTTKKAKKKAVKKYKGTIQNPTTIYDTFDWQTLGNYCQFKPNLKTVAEMMNVSESTLKDYIKKKFSETYTEFAERKMSGIKLKLVQKAISMALAGDRTMLIFCLKNYCGWSDIPEQTQDDNFELEFVG